MTKKFYEVEYDDNLHLADASDDPNYKRGLLYDDEGNLKTHAKMREVDENELRDRYGEQGQFDYDFDYHNHKEAELTPEQQEAARLAGEVLAAALITLIAVATPRVQRWWEKTATPKIKGIFGKVAEFFRSISRKRKKPKRRNEKNATLQLAETTLQVNPKSIRSELDDAYEDYCNNISSKEAQKAFVEIVILASMLAERINKLSRARISDEHIAGGYIGWQEAVERLSSQELISSVNRILRGDMKLLSDSQLASLEVVLSRKLYVNDKYIPIGDEELHDRLIPRPTKKIREDNSNDSETTHDTD